MNKRSAPRFPVTLDVDVLFPDETRQTCTVRDYCSGGMYLLCERGWGDSSSAQRGDVIRIEFDDPLMPQGAHYGIDARIVRFEGHGMGVAFTREDAQVVIALSQLAASQAAGASGVAGSAMAGETYGKSTVEQLIQFIRSKARGRVGTILELFFDQAQSALFDAAGESSSNVQQSSYFGAMNELRKGSANLAEAFLQKLDGQFEILTEPGFRNPFQQEAASEGGLSLVESDELDHWLAVRAMSAKLEERLGETLEALETRLEEISANPISLENNPAGPFVLSSIFREMLNRIVLDDTPRKLLFSVMERLLGEQLKGLYDELNEGMIAQGILPTIQKKMEVIKKPGSSGYAAEPQFVEEGEADDSHPQGSDTGVQSQPGQPSISRGGAPSSGYADTRSQGNQGAPVQEGAGIEQGDAVPRESMTDIPAGEGQQEGIEPVESAQTNPINYTRPRSTSATAAAGRGSGERERSSQAVHKLMQLQQPAGGEQAVTAPAAGYYTSGQVVRALERIGRSLDEVVEGGDTIDHINQLTQVLAEATGAEGKALSEGDQEAVAYVGGMFSSIHNDALVAEQARPWFRRLEVPLLKAGILDNSLLEDDDHPAREILNRLEAIGDLLQNDDSPEAQEARRRIEAILNEVNEKVESEPEVFADALAELDEVQESVEGSFEENIKQLILQCKKEKEINDARRIILDELNKRLGKRDVPVVVLHLLDSGWKNLLLRTLMKHGGENIAFKTYLNVVDLLTARLTGESPYLDEAKMPDEDLLEWVSRMLSMVSSNEQKNALLIRELKKDLGSDEGAGAETRYVPALISRTVEPGHRAEADKPEEISDDVWPLMLEDAKQLADREAFLYRPAEGEPLQVSLVWRDGERRFVFADNRGHKALDLELGEVANELYHKTLSRMNEKELSVTERATYSFLQSLHNQIAYQANHDELTGLLNRKAFELELDTALEEAKAGKATHVLGYFDLDRFNIINTTCGHAEGDKLLTKVAEVLNEVIDDEAVVARLGGDEFGIILRNCSRTLGLKQLTSLHDRVRDIRFACDNNEFKVTCSMGVTEVNEASDSSGRLLSAVDSATFTAKDNGRDNIQIHNIENERISSRRHILDWVGRINVLFDKDLIQFRCQKIAPVHKTVNSLPHYEVLLDVHDEEGNKVPLEEFIVAAERYNRILDIDTWVVNNLFDWLEKHSNKLDRISNLSLNLSGSSFGNRRFMDEVYQRLSKPGFPAAKVCFEVTETTAMSNLDNSARFMNKLKETGCHFSLDDFGSGTSSYAYLRSLPIDYLKIDMAFVKDIATNSSDYAVVKSINEIGHVMGKQTVAEGVEDEFAYQLLHDIGIDFVQGFGVEKPIPLKKLFG